MVDLFVSAFFTLFVVIDPIGCAPIFAGLTAGTPAAHARGVALRASLIASLILLAFALGGKPLLAALNIGLDAFRIAGGIMLFLIALEMVFEKRTQKREERAEKALHTPPAEDISVFPMAMPMIAGPGSIATVMLMMGRAQGLAGGAVVLAALACVLAITLVALLAARPIMTASQLVSRTMRTASSGVTISPLPITGILTALHVSQTMRKAMGLMAGPDSPAVTLEIRGLRVSASIAMATNVFTSEMASAPASSATRAICGMLVTLGDSFTITGRVAIFFTALTTSDSMRGSVPNAIPPHAVFGHDTLSS